MRIFTTPERHHPAAPLVLALGLLSGSAALAANDGAAQAQYQKDRATCLAGESGQDQDTCLREAAAALQEARQDARQAGQTAPAPQPDYERNALARCDAQPTPDDRASCRLRMQAPAQGSVRGGGLLREATETLRP